MATSPLGRGAAVVSFHLSADANPNRRTLVWRREREGWRIVHLHASRVPPPAER
jgi:ketosteroid isomerase-like protein